jgi:hypothetical protein
MSGVESGPNLYHYITLHHELFKVHTLLQERFDSQPQNGHLTDYITRDKRVVDDLAEWQERCGVPSTPRSCYVETVLGDMVFESVIVLINVTILV